VLLGEGQQEPVIDFCPQDVSDLSNARPGTSGLAEQVEFATACLRRA
jgi:hypothetical protein